MRKSAKNYIEDILRDYPKLLDYIAEREDEIRYPVRQLDENVGGGKSSVITKPQESTLITIEQDERLTALKRQYNIIHDLYESTDDDTRALIREKYFKKHPEYTVDGLIMDGQIFCSRRTAYQKQSDFLEELAKKLNVRI